MSDNLIPEHFWILQHLVSVALFKLHVGSLLPMPFVRLRSLVLIPFPHVFEHELQIDHSQVAKQEYIKY